MSTSSSIIRETYPLIPPFAHALIQTDPNTHETVYKVVETGLRSHERKVYNTIVNFLYEEIDQDFNELRKQGEGEDEKYLISKVREIVKNYRIAIDDKVLDKIFYFIKRDFIGFGRIEPIFKDHLIEDIDCDGPGIPIFVYHREHERIPTNIIFDDEAELDSFVIKLAQRAGRHISVASPLLDASLPDGSRIQLTYQKEVTARGSTFTVRKFRSDPMTIVDLIQFNSIDEFQTAYFWMALEFKKSILISGGTASGKTTLLNSLAMFTKPGAKIVSIEDTAEINIPHENWIPSVARTGFGATEADGRKRGEIDLFDLLRAALRQRPDYLFVGEVRGAEAGTMFQAMATGHAGMGTIHGDSVAGVIRRLESNPMNIPRALIQSLNIIDVQRRVQRGNKMVRRSIEIVEIVGMDPVTGDLITNRTFAWNPRNDTFTYFGRSYVFEDIMNQQGMTEHELMAELERRQLIIKWMVKKGINYYKDVAQVVRDYYARPEEMIVQCKKDLKAV
ncbi:MAG: type II/IV secretion system ATPase subunit [Promethearchaeota archaeon]